VRKVVTSQAFIARLARLLNRLQAEPDAALAGASSRPWPAMARWLRWPARWSP
jgi:trehalose-6-phosphatase